VTVCVLGGYGTFGRLIVEALLDRQIDVAIVGRHQEALEAMLTHLRRVYPAEQCRGLVCDIEQDISAVFTQLRPQVVINTCGPFQEQDYRVAQACIAAKVHYIDLADARDFVTGIDALHEQAQQAGVLVVSGASTVPALSSAVIEHYQQHFSRLDRLQHGITPGQKSPRGLATTLSILTYLGKPIKSKLSHSSTRYGWQDMYRQAYPELGKRWMANCDVPDLDLFVDRYGLSDIRFSAGMESTMLHIGMWFCAWCVRLRLPINFAKHARFLLRASHWFDRFGSDAGGMHVVLSGVDHQGEPLRLTWFLIAKAGDGPRIPTMPAVILAEQLLHGNMQLRGAQACVGLIGLSDYLQALAPYAVTSQVTME
jgi:hypothetical protein